MNKIYLYFLLLLTFIPLFSCQRTQYKSQVIDTNSYINNFELLQKNQKNYNNIRITSPRAIIDNKSNDIEIFNSSIEILDTNGNDISVIADKSILNNSLKLISVYKNVKISLIDTKNYFIKTDSFNWDLKTSNINLDSPLDINLETTQIKSSGGIYNIKSGILSINNNKFNRRILNSDGEENYQIEINSDNAKWIKNNNTLEFTSNNKQVESTINFLGIK